VKLKQKLSKLRAIDKEQRQEMARLAEKREAKEYHRQQQTKASRKKRDTAMRDATAKARADRALAAARYRIRAPLDVGEAEEYPGSSEEEGQTTDVMTPGRNSKLSPPIEGAVALSPGQLQAKRRLSQAAKERKIKAEIKESHTNVRLEKNHQAMMAARAKSMSRIREYHSRDRAARQQATAKELDVLAQQVDATKAEQVSIHNMCAFRTLAMWDVVKHAMTDRVARREAHEPESVGMVRWMGDGCEMDGC